MRQTWTMTSLMYKYSTELQKQDVIVSLSFPTVFNPQELKNFYCSKINDHPETEEQKEREPTRELAKSTPVVKALHWQNEVDHHSIPYQSINHSKPDKPSEFTNVDFCFHKNHNQHRAPTKSLNNQGQNLP